MAQPNETFDAYDAIGNREDLSNIIHNISPTLTPFQNNITRGKATNILHEWQTESLDAVDPNNAHIDGDDATGDAITPTVRVNNQCQILRKTIIHVIMNHYNIFTTYFLNINCFKFMLSKVVFNVSYQKLYILVIRQSVKMHIVIFIIFNITYKLV